MSLPRCFGILSTSLLAFALTSAVSLAETVATDPVGFVTLNVAGTSNGGSTALSFKSLGLARPVEFQGLATSSTGNSLTVSNAGWTDNQFNGANGAYYVEITGAAGGAGVGTTYDISGTTAGTQTITLAQSLASAISATPTFRIRKHWTLATVFGTPGTGGLVGGTAASADNVLVYNAASKVYDSYYYSTGGLPGTGWRKDGAGNAPQDGAVLYPDDGLLIQRKQATAANVVLMGAVKTGQSSFPILGGLNILANPYAAPMKLSTSNLYTADGTTGLNAGSASTADLVLIYNGTSYDAYYYSSGGLPGTGWRQDGGGTAVKDSIEIPVGSSFLVQRRNGSAFNWVAPQHPTSF